jgi:hypothetical protein
VGLGDSPCTPRGEFAVAVGAAISCLPACELTPHALGLVGGTAGVVRKIIGVVGMGMGMGTRMV